MRRPHTAAVLLLLWLAVLTVAFHGCGGRLACGGLVARRPTIISVGLPRKMLLAVASLDAASPTDDHPHSHHHHHPHHHHQHHHHHHVDLWNRQGIPPSTNGEEIDPRYGVQKRLVPTGPNPLHH